MQVKRIITAGDSSNTALRIVGVTLSAILLGDNSDRAHLRHLQGKSQPGDAAADNQKINFVLPGHTSNIEYLGRRDQIYKEDSLGLSNRFRTQRNFRI